MKSKNSLLKFVITILLGILSQFPAVADNHRLGFSGPLSGAWSSMGEDIKNTLEFANQKLAGAHYKFVFEDDQCEPKNALTVAKKLTSINSVNVAFIACGQAVMATANTYHHANATVITPFSTPSRISALGVFRTSMSDAVAAKILADYIAAHHKSVFILTEENDYSEELRKDFVNYAEKIKLITSGESYRSGELDFRAQLARLKQKKIEAIFLNSQTNEALIALIKQLAELNIKPVIYGAFLPGSASFLKIAGKSADGIVFVDFPSAMELMNDDGKKLYQEFTDKYGPMKTWSFIFPATLEAFRAIDLAVKSNQPIAEYLKNATFQGSFGSYTFDKNGDIVGPAHVLRTIKNGSAELISK